MFIAFKQFTNLYNDEIVHEFTMNTKLLGATFVAIAALVGTPIMAEAIMDLDGVKVRADTTAYNTIMFKTAEPVLEEGLVIPGGFAIPTELGDYIAVVSHNGTLDSISQVDEFDALWHSHIVIASVNPSCESLAVDALTFEEPSVVDIRNSTRGNFMLLHDIDIATTEYTDSITNSTMNFIVGDPVFLPVGTALVESRSFDLIVNGTTTCLDVVQ